VTQATAARPLLEEYGLVGPWYVKKATPLLQNLKLKRIAAGVWSAAARYWPRPRPCINVDDGGRWQGQFDVLSESERVVYRAMKDVAKKHGKRLEKGDTVTLSLRDLRRITGYSESRLSRIIGKLIYHKVIAPWNPITNSEGIRRMRGEQAGNRVKTTYYLPYYDSVQAAWRDDPAIAKDLKFGKGQPWTRGRGKRFLTPDDFQAWEIDGLPAIYGRPGEGQAAAVAAHTETNIPSPSAPITPTVWDAIKQSLKSSMSKEAWRNWIRRTHLKAIDGSTLDVYVPDEATLVCLRADYPQVYEQAAAAGYSIRFEVQPTAHEDALVAGTETGEAVAETVEFSEELLAFIDGYVGSSDSYVQGIIRDWRTTAAKLGYKLTDANIRYLVGRAGKRQQPKRSYNAAWFRTVVIELLPGECNKWRDQAAKALREAVRTAQAELAACASAAERESLLAKLRRDEPDVYEAVIRPPPRAG
jgi:hypothetical protein